MEFIDLKTQQDRIRGQIDRRNTQVLDHGCYIMGPEIEELESALSTYLRVRHSIGASSGTDAPLIALMALGVKTGDEVITATMRGLPAYPALNAPQ